MQTADNGGGEEAEADHGAELQEHAENHAAALGLEERR